MLTIQGMENSSDIFQMSNFYALAKIHVEHYFNMANSVIVHTLNYY